MAPSTFIEVSDGKLHDVNILDAIVPEPASFYVMDRACVDFQRLHVLHRGVFEYASARQAARASYRRPSHALRLAAW